MKVIHNVTKEEFVDATFWKYRGMMGLLVITNDLRVLFVYQDGDFGLDYDNLTDEFTFINL
jgi:hypothetical protein